MQSQGACSPSSLIDQVALSVDWISLTSNVVNLALTAMNTKHTHQSHYGGGDEGVARTYHSEENIFYEKGSELEDWQLKHTGRPVRGY